MIVSETDEDLYSDEEPEKPIKNRLFSLSQFSKLMAKKIYSDDFDISFESRNKKKQQLMGSMLDFPISEDVESEDGKDYLSDGSSSTFSFHKRKMSLEFSKLIDRSEH